MKLSENTEGEDAVPHARNAHTVITTGSTLLLFGGFWHDVPEAGAWVDCSKDEHGCLWFSDIWTLPLPATKLEYIDVSWTKTSTGPGPAPCGRFGHSSSRIGDRMLVFGGHGESGVLGDLWELDLKRFLWTELTPAGKAFPSPRSQHVAGVLGGSLIVFGGEGGGHELWRYDPSRSVESLLSDNSVQLPQPTQPACATESDLVGLKAGLVVASVLCAFALMGLCVAYSRLSSATKAAGSYAIMEDDMEGYLNQGQARGEVQALAVRSPEQREFESL